MKCLTVRQPFAAAIIFGPKRIENRDWNCTHRGPLLIHAGKSRRMLHLLTDAQKASWPGREAAPLDFGFIIGSVDVVDCQIFGERHAGNPWAERNYCIELANPRPLRTPLPAMGLLGLWNFEGDGLDYFA